MKYHKKCLQKRMRNGMNNDPEKLMTEVVWNESLSQIGSLKAEKWGKKLDFVSASLAEMIETVKEWRFDLLLETADS